MGRTFTCREVIDRLNATVKRGYPIIGTAASVGIVAKCAEIAGTDLIIIHSTGRTRIMGLATHIVGDSNRLTLAMHQEISQVVNNTPVIAGLDANDVYNTDHEKLLKVFMDAGISGMIHCPQVSLYGAQYRWKSDSVGFGFGREMELTALAHKKGLFNMAYCFTTQDAVDMVRAGADCIVAHVGGTRGGLAGYASKDYDEACALVNSIIDAAKGVNPDTICLAHGGPFAEPEDTKVIYERTKAVGFVGASSIERIPIERAVAATVKEFKDIPLRKQ